MYGLFGPSRPANGDLEIALACREAAASKGLEPFRDRLLIGCIDCFVVIRGGGTKKMRRLQRVPQFGEADRVATMV